MTSFLIILQVFVCVLLIALVLLQPSKGGSFFTASNQGVFGSSGGTTFLFRATMWCAVFLAASCIFLTWFKVHEQSESVVPDTTTSAPAQSTTAPGAPVTSPLPTAVPPPATTAPVAPAKK